MSASPSGEPLVSHEPSYDDLALFAAFAPAAMAMFDREMRYLVVNERWQSDYSLDGQVVIGRSHYDVFPDLPPIWREVHRRCLNGAIEKSDEDRFERTNGAVYWLRWEVRPWRTAVGSIGGLLIFSEDITDRKELELAILESTTREQHRFGRDLHDGLGQDLTALSMLAAALAESESRTGKANPEASANLARLAQRAIATCRATAHGLSPLEYSENNLVLALNELLALQVGAFGVETKLDVSRDGQLKLDLAVQEHLYRIAQEAVANARRHARAKSISVRLHIEETRVRMEVLDDGIGLGGPARRGPGIGLRVMGVRAALIGARLAVGPGPRAGTLVTVECPQSP